MEDARSEDSENIILIVQDNAGNDQGSSDINPRGILNATLYDNANGFTSWKVVETAGGAIGVDIDLVWTAYSQGGLMPSASVDNFPATMTRTGPKAT